MTAVIFMRALPTLHLAAVFHWSKAAAAAVYGGSVDDSHTWVAARNPSPRPVSFLTKAGLVLFSFVISNVFE